LLFIKSHIKISFYYSNRKIERKCSKRIRDIFSSRLADQSAGNASWGTLLQALNRDDESENSNT